MPTIDQDLCVKCFACANVCPACLFIAGNDTLALNKELETTCVTCGQCMAICPTKAVKVNGLDYADFKDLPKNKPSKDELHALLVSRRSIRNYEEKAVSRELLEEIIQLSTCAPLGFPPSAVEIIVLDNRKEIDEVISLLVKEYDSLNKQLKNPVTKAIIKNLIGDAFEGLEKKHVITKLPHILKIYHEKGEDKFSYHCPVLLIFHANKKDLSPQEDCMLALMYVVAFAETVGLGTCLSGLIGGGIDQSKTLRKKLGIPPENRVICGMSMGYPKYEYKRSIPRKFASVKWGMN